MADITAEQVEEFQRNGAICLRGVFDLDCISKLEQGIIKVLSAPSPYSENLPAEGGSGKYFNDYCNWRAVPEFCDFVFNSSAAEIVGKLMQSKYSVFYHEHILIKEPCTNKKTPWHQDQAYYPIDGDKACSIWMPLDPVSMETTLEFVSGSHSQGIMYTPRKFATSNNYPVVEPDGLSSFQNVPDIDAEREKYDIIKWAVEPGDIIVFHMKTLHGAPENMMSIPRRVFTTRWLGDDCKLARRPWVTSPPTLGGLSYGDDVVCSEFPLMWRAGGGTLD